MRPPPSSASRPTPVPAAPPPAAAAAALAASPWHSPVPYLFGGLGAMLALITLALLILACSYWKLNNYLGTGDAAAAPGATDGDGSKSPATAAAASPATFPDLVAVVMAGERTPTFLAAPIVRRPRGGDNSGGDAAAGDRSPETEEEDDNHGKVGEGESGAVAGDRRDRQLDHV
ncbi:unnamed protein product [Urochloa decumbens]|uniref:Uncharacterized protein n=1 Tax=Urochloa decumbens TaxID=240449 RepID=A0ABC9BPG4_9POAL